MRERDPISEAKGQGRVSTSIPGSLGRIDPNASLPQDPESRPAPGHDGEVSPRSWLRGAGEDATAMPGFDCGPSGDRSSKKGR